ncbi:hypothetical protein KC946_02390 [Candidatus Saccharibacteria bacterium]|nr:hypothetical protein [Candidatus Saccharibacteria bacterium]
MFDQNDQNQQASNPVAQPTGIQNTTTPDIADPNMSAPATAPAADVNAGAVPADSTASSTPSAPIPQDLTPSNPSTTVEPTVKSPVDLNSSSPASPSEPAFDATVNSANDSSSTSSSDSTSISPSTLTSPSKDNDLQSIKKDALGDLTPLLDHLDLSPEEKFRTTMMLIQASDDKSLIQSAYSAAQKITDEKEKAQALLDIVNEINYFTQAAEEKSQPEVK